MKTKHITFTFSFLFLVLIFGCVKHEIIPAPIKTVDLKVSFQGTINHTKVEFTDNIDGFNGEPSNAMYKVTAPQLSSISYFCNMTSNTINKSIKVGIGSLFWDAGALSSPSVTQFNDFCTRLKDSLEINYGDKALNGFEVTYKDNFGNVFVSDPNSVNPQSVLFTAINNDFDKEGEYSKFTVEFSCYLYRSISQTERDSIYLENCKFSGWFQR
jgi:hypothetical protein